MGGRAGALNTKSSAAFGPVPEPGDEAPPTSGSDAASDSSSSPSSSSLSAPAMSLLLFYLSLCQLLDHSVSRLQKHRSHQMTNEQERLLSALLLGEWLGLLGLEVARRSLIISLRVAATRVAIVLALLQQSSLRSSPASILLPIRLIVTAILLALALGGSSPRSFLLNVTHARLLLQLLRLLAFSLYESIADPSWESLPLFHRRSSHAPWWRRRVIVVHRRGGCSSAPPAIVANLSLIVPSSSHRRHHSSAHHLRHHLWWWRPET
ncbi:hypothetical protein PMAYCL1PPCAC_25557, partial [Pristionchus mayeri]